MCRFSCFALLCFFFFSFSSMSVCFFWQPATYWTFLITIVLNVFGLIKFSISLSLLVCFLYNTCQYCELIWMLFLIKKLLPLSRRQNIAVESRAAGTVMFTCVQRGTQLVMSISVIINSCHLHLSTTLLVILCWLPTLFAARSSAILQLSNPHHIPADGSCRLVYSRRSKTIDVSCIPAVVITALSLLSHSAFYKVKCLNEVNVRNCTAEVLKITRVYLSDN